MEWVLLFVLWAPVLGALLLRSAVRDHERRVSVLGVYVRAALLLHALALPPMLISYDAALLVLAGFDGALLLLAWAAWRDERALQAVLAAIHDRQQVDRGVELAGQWLAVLGGRRGGDAVRLDHALAIARALAEVGREREADRALESIPRASLAVRDATRLTLTLGLFSIDRGNLTRARMFIGRALARAPFGASEMITARAAWALLDSVEGFSRRALAGLGRIPASLASPLDRALVALARANALAARGDTVAARAILRAIDPSARFDLERLARSCPGPATPILQGMDRSSGAPYR